MNINSSKILQADRNFSAAIINYLCQTQKSLSDVARILGVSRAYISLVGKGQRSLTIEHLIRLEKELNVGLAALVVEGILSGKTEKTKSKYKDLLLLLNESTDLRISTSTNNRKKCG